MDSSIIKKAGELLGEKSRHRHWQIAVTALAAVVVVVTAYFLSKPAQTLVKDTCCGIEEHAHTEECYAQELICGYEEVEAVQTVQTVQEPLAAPAHQHDDTCYMEERELICGQEESEGHTHTEACRTVTESSELTCGQEEGADHSHTDACYTVKQTEELTCGQEETPGHSHTDACYTVNRTEELTCGQEEDAGHSHTDACYETVRKLVCGKEETQAGEAAGQIPEESGADMSAGSDADSADNDAGSSAEGAENSTDAADHVHTEACYAKALLCKAEEHTHEDLCYESVFCGITGHTHGTACYDGEGSLICEAVEHRHTDNCYKEPHCGITAHTHGAACRDGEGSLICEAEEHIHTDECYITNTYFCADRIHIHSNDCYDLEGNLLCGSADYMVHSHSESCYDRNERLICPLPEKEEEELHTHTEECYGVRGVLICGLTEVLRHDHGDDCRIESSEPWFDTVSAAAYCGILAHTHKDGCKDSEGNAICGLEEHSHTGECYEETGYNCISGIHVHEADCYDAEGNLRCGLADYVIHTHNALCYGMDGKLLCTLPETEPHVHGDGCYGQASAESDEEEEVLLICTLPETEVHEHKDDCRDENGKLICGKLQTQEHEHTKDCIIDAAEIEITQTYKGADFIVTATYNKKEANLPEEAGLFAERIAKEGNEEYYAERAAQYEAMQGVEEDTMQILMRIGFTVEGAEVEPEAPVTIKVQFLDENGMEEGSPVTVVHFGAAGNERLDGSNAEKNSTTFRMNSFSEIALGWKKPVDTVTVDKTFTYEDEAFTAKFHVEGEAVLPTQEEIEEAGDNVTNEDLEAVVEPLGEDTKEYEAALAYAEETGAENGMLFLQVLSYGLLYKDTKLDLTGCRVTVEITPAEALVEFAEAGEASVMAIDGAMDTGEDPGSDVSLVSGNISAADNGFIVGEVAASTISRNTADVPLIYDVIAEGTDNVTAVMSSSQANPKFTVKYIATLDVVEKNEEGDANIQPVVINTDTTAGGKMPVNKDMNLPVWYLSTVDTGNGKYEIASTGKQTEVYKEKEFEFITAPGLVYVDSLARNGNYKLVAIEVVNKDGEKERYDCCTLKCGNEKHTHISTCYLNCNINHEHADNCYNGAKEWSFTNKRETQEKYPDDFILIKDGITLNLLYVLTTDKPSNDMKFYDYDISDGRLYSSSAIKNGNPSGKEIAREGATTHNSGADVWYMYTDKQGINNNVAGQNFGFGNSSNQTRTTLGEVKWKNNLLNRANNEDNGEKFGIGGASFGGCTFGLAVSLKKDGTIQYDSEIKAPNLFNDGAALGKSEYDGSLTFERTGDTYTLTDAKVTENGESTNISNLDSFTKIPNWNKTRFLWTNLYYPLDNVSSAGSDGHDLMFGKADTTKLVSFAKEDYISPSNGNRKKIETVPASDDGMNHNHYFGMWYTVDFDLTEDYIGPLEYIFYGDDDMWVFLDGNGERKVEDADGNQVIEKSSIDGRLICDIGGVHGAVGEYVNLWNYIEEGTTGHYRLSFFYTERGASGSTCWMQFTLPSVSFITPKQTTGQLQIEKEVTGAETEEEFGFTIGFYEDETMETPLMHNFSYEKRKYLLDENGEIRKDGDGKPLTEFVSNDVLIWDGACFTLKANEYITISYLPDGAYYKITEVGPVIANKDGDRLKYFEDGTPDWVVVKDDPYKPDITGGNLDSKDSSGRTVTGVVRNNNMVQIHYNNMHSFVLPETGGSGNTIIYALAGAFGILSGAGLVYRKKFRERRA